MFVTALGTEFAGACGEERTLLLAFAARFWRGTTTTFLRVGIAASSSAVARSALEGVANAWVKVLSLATSSVRRFVTRATFGGVAGPLSLLGVRGL